MRGALVLLALLLSIALGYWLGRGSVLITTTETVRVDTLFYERPQPVKTSPPTFVSVRVPRLLFTPADTVMRTVVVSAGEDSVQLQLAIECREYRDSTYRAQVSGPAVGEYRPTLDWIEVYNRTTERVQTITKRPRFAVTAGVGAAYTPKGFQPYAGIGVGVILWQF